ncbi:MAG: pilus assembly protein [bacterium]|nr:pilus assembly protein [bacterium]
MREKKAQAFVEFILISIPFFIVLMGVFQFAHIAVVKIIINHAAFTTARVASVHERYDMLFQAVAEVIPFKDKENINIDVISQQNNEEIKVILTYNMALIFPFANKLIKEVKGLSGYNLPITSECSLPKENFIS